MLCSYCRIMHARFCGGDYHLITILPVLYVSLIGELAIRDPYSQRHFYPGLAYA
jgi:hypothetical protein